MKAKLTRNAFPIWHTPSSVVLLKYQVWCVCCRQSEREMGGKSQFYSNPAILSTPKMLGGISPPSLSLWQMRILGIKSLYHSQDFLSPDCNSLTSDKMLKVKCMLAHSPFFLINCMGFSVLLTTKSVGDFGGALSLHTSVCSVWGQRAWWMGFNVSDMEKDSEIQTARERPAVTRQARSTLHSFSSEGSLEGF